VVGFCAFYYGVDCLIQKLVVYGDFKKDIEYDYLENAEIVIYELEDGKTASAVVYDTEANKVFEITAARKGSKIELSFTETDKSFTVKVSGTDKSVKVTGGSNAVIEL